MPKKRVLVFPAGAENALEIYDALCFNVNVEVFGASGKKDFAQYRYDGEHYIEGDFYISKPGFLSSFNDVLQKYHIDVVIPTHDDVALFLASNRDDLFAKILVSEADTARICRQKSLTYTLFAGERFCPAVFPTKESITEFPVFLNYDSGAGSVGAKIIKSAEELMPEYFSNEYVLCEYLTGNELSVDCFTDRNSEVYRSSQS